ncbi:MAG: DUF4010 domain-containing protein [Comamonas sp.]
MLQSWNGSSHWIVSLGVGLLIGVASERREAAQRSSAGVRTHALTALLGCIAWSLGVGPFMVATLLVGALVVAAYWHSARRDPGLTGEVALLFSMTLGALSHESAATAAALGVLCALLVHAKGVLQRWSRELLREQELRDGLLLAAAALVVMPLLPRQPIDPWGVLRLTTLWRVVVLIMAVGMLGHVLNRALGARWGLPVAGFFSGFASSTAAVVHFGQRVRADGQPWAVATACAMLSQLASLGLLAAVLGASMALLQAMLGPLAAAASMAQLHASGSLPLPMAQWGMAAVLAASAAAKSALAFIVGGWRYGLGIGPGLFSMAGATGLALWWQS